MTINIGINGYGRIGRNILRALYESEYHKDLKIVAINDVGDNSVSAHLTKYDSAHGKFNKEVSADNNFMYVDGDKINITSERHKNKYISMLANDNKLSDDFWALEEINNSIKKGKVENILKYSFDVQLALSYPNPKLPEEDKKVIWQILVKLSTIKDVALQYLFDKNQFFAEFNEWGEKKQDWAIEHIKANKNQLFNFKLKK